MQKVLITCCRFCCIALLTASASLYADDLQNLPGMPSFLPVNANTPIAANTSLPIPLNPVDPEELTLRDAVLLALHKNPNLNMSINNRALQRYDLLVAEQAFRPQVTLGSSATYNNYSDNQGNNSITRSANVGPQVTWQIPLGTTFTGQFGYTPSNQTGSNSSTTNGSSWTVTIEQPLLQNFGVDVNEVGLNNAIDQQKIDSMQLQQTVMTTIITTISDYYALAQAEQNEDIAKQSLKDKKKTLFIRQEEHKAGRIPGTDVTQAQLDITTQQQAVQQAHLATETAKAQLLTTDLGLPEDTKFHIVPTLEIKKLSPPPISKSIAEAMTQNLDLLIAELNYKQQQRNMLTSANARRWNLNLTVSRSHTLQDQQFEQAGINTDTNTATNNTSATLNLSIPLDRVSIDQQELSAATSMNNAEITLETAKRTLASNITTSIHTLENLWVQLQVSEENLTFSEINTKAAEIKFGYGKLDAFTLSQQQQQLQAAQQNVVSSKVAYLKQILTFEQQMGTLLNDWNIQFKAPDNEL
jgi:outer membrane protein TolC